MTLVEAYQTLLRATVQVGEEPEVAVLDVKPETHRREFSRLIKLTEDETVPKHLRDALHAYVVYHMDGWPERELQNVDR